MKIIATAPPVIAPADVKNWLAALGDNNGWGPHLQSANRTTKRAARYVSLYIDPACRDTQKAKARVPNMTRTFRRLKKYLQLTIAEFETRLKYSFKLVRRILILLKLMVTIGVYCHIEGSTMFDISVDE